MRSLSTPNLEIFQTQDTYNQTSKPKTLTETQKPQPERELKMTRKRTQTPSPIPKAWTEILNPKP
jgi:hypothetical protein